MSQGFPVPGQKLPRAVGLVSHADPWFSLFVNLRIVQGDTKKFPRALKISNVKKFY